MAEQVVALGDQLDVGVLDSVVNHLHVVPGPVRADVGTAGSAVDLGGDRRQDRLHLCVGFPCPAGHDARAFERPLLPAAHAGADEPQALRFHFPRPALGVSEEGVAAVDHDGGVDGVARLDHEQDRPRVLDGGDQVCRRAGGSEVSLLAELLDEVLRAAPGAVVEGDREAVASDVPSQVLAHHGQPEDTELCLAHAPQDTTLVP